MGIHSPLPQVPLLDESQRTPTYFCDAPMTQAIRSSRSEVQRPLASTSPPLLLTNVRLPGYLGRKRLWVSPQGIVEAIEAMDQACERLPEPGLQVIDLGDRWLSLGGVDLQINGALGLAFTDLNAANGDRLGEICKYLWQEGIDAFLPTLVTSAPAQIQQALAVIEDYCQRPSEAETAKILGVHLEGPCLAPAKCGAHPPEYLQPLTPETMAEILGDRGHMVKMVTLAPELDPSGEVIRALCDRNIAVSLGHSQATAAEAQRAFDQGATLVTHAFNAMPGLHHREPGLLGAALTQPQPADPASPAKSTVRCGFIADGQHISPTMLALLWRLGGRDRLFLVSDALAPLGLPDGTYPWDRRQITVTEGTARLADGTLSGTTRSLLVGVKNLAEWGICSVEAAIDLAVSAPRQAIGDRSDYPSQRPSLHSSLNSRLNSRLNASQHPSQYPSQYPAQRQAPQYVGQSLYHLLQWTWDEAAGSLAWKRFAPLPSWVEMGR